MRQCVDSEPAVIGGTLLIAGALMMTSICQSALAHPLGLAAVFGLALVWLTCLQRRFRLLDEQRLCPLRLREPRVSRLP